MEDDIEQGTPESEAREPGARLAFELPPELSARTEEILAKLKSAEDRKAHAPELVEVVLELTRYGLDAYYFQPLELAEVGFASRSTAKAGIAAGRKGISLLVRRVLGSMTDEQLLAVAEFMDSILIRNETT